MSVEWCTSCHESGTLACSLSLLPGWVNTLGMSYAVNQWPSGCFCFQAVAELRKSGLEMNFTFLNYAQSSECRNWQDSSVSYAAGALIVHWGRHWGRGHCSAAAALSLLSIAITWPRLPPSHPSPSFAHYLQEGPRHSKPIQSSFSVSPSSPPLPFSILLSVWSVSQSFWLIHFAWSAVLRVCWSKWFEEIGRVRINLAQRKRRQGEISCFFFPKDCSCPCSPCLFLFTNDGFEL